MNSLQVWYMMAADEVRILCGVLAVVCLVCCVVRRSNKMKFSKTFALISLVFAVLVFVLPSSRDMAIIVAGPPMVERAEKMEDAAQRGYDKAKDWWKERKEKKKETPAVP